VVTVGVPRVQYAGRRAARRRHGGITMSISLLELVLQLRVAEVGAKTNADENDSYVCRASSGPLLVVRAAR